MQLIKPRWWLLMALMMILALVVPGRAQAVEGMGIGLFPANPDPNIPYSQAWLIYNLVPGETKQDAFVVVNQGDKPVTLRLYPVDALVTKDGSFALKDESAPRQGVGAWVKLETDKLTLKPGERRLVNFTFTVPPNAEVGDHMGGIIAERIDQVEGQEGAIKVKTRIGLRIYETVPGELIRDLKVTRFSVSFEEKNKDLPDRIRLNFELSNEGNVHLNPTAYVSLVRSPGSGEVLSRQVSLGTIFPNTKTVVPVVWEDVPWWGRFVVKAKISYDPDNPDVYIVRQASLFYVSNRAKKALIGVVLVVLVGLGWLVGRMTGYQKTKSIRRRR